MNSIIQDRKQRMIWSSLSLLMAAVSGAIGILNWIMLRTLVLTLLKLSSISPWSWQAIDNFSFLIFGILWLTFVLLIQHYYLKSVEKKKLWQNAIFVTGIQILLLFVCQLPPFVSGKAQFDKADLFILAVQCIIGLFLVVFGSIARNKHKKLLS